METSDKTLAEVDFVIKMIDYQTPYIYKRLPKSEQIVFLATITALRRVCVTSPNLASLQNNIILFAEDNLKKRNFFLRLFSNPLPTRTLAVDVAQDILDSVRVRFNDGGSKTYLGLFSSRSIAVSPDGN